MSEATPKKRGRILRYSGIFIGLIILLIISIFLSVFLMIWLQIDDLQDIRSALQSIRPVFTGIRVSIYINIIIFWNRLITYVANRYNWDAKRLENTLKHRTHVGIVLLVIELFIGQRLLVAIFN